MQQSVKLLMIFLLMFAFLGFSGCTCKPKVVTKTIEVKIPVKCKVPETKCSFDGMNNTEIITELIRCTYAHKEAAKVCQ